jgi:hypothetical protein
MEEESGAALRARRRSDLVNDVRTASARLDDAAPVMAEGTAEPSTGVDQMRMLMDEELFDGDDDEAPEHSDPPSSQGFSSALLPAASRLPPPHSTLITSELDALRSELERGRQRLEAYARRMEEAEARAEAAERRAAAAEAQAAAASHLVPMDRMSESSQDDPFDTDEPPSKEEQTSKPVSRSVPGGPVVATPARPAGGPSLLRCLQHWFAEPEAETEHLNALRRSTLRPDQVSTPHLATKVYCRSLTPSGEPVGEGERNVRGEPHGKGAMVFAHGAGYYVGEWRRGQMEVCIRSCLMREG